MNLVIVESPTKAKTISRFLGDDFEVDSSYGHVRDLPKTTMGIDIDDGSFNPRYRVPKEAKKHINRLKKKLKDADAVYLATDEDREGEAIAWHLLEALDIDEETAKRMVFHEITKEAIDNALNDPRGIDRDLVDAQQARRILDRLVGYTLSPLLWRKVARGLSAGRVQSVAVRLIVDRERERQAFEPEEYWSIEARLQSQINADSVSADADNTQNDAENKNTSASIGVSEQREADQGESTFTAKLWERDGKRVKKKAIKTEDEARAIVDDAKDGTWQIADVNQSKTRRNPLPPYTTSTLQQDAARRLSFSAKRTMAVAQMLYETGLITYMRTDSVNIARSALKAGRTVIENRYGNDYLPKKPRHYTTEQKRAQEAHEAIRPTDPSKTPNDVNLNDDGQRRLYQLIWSRFLASQMTPAVFQKTTAGITVSGGQHDYRFRARGQTLVFDGFTAVYSIKSKEELLPPLSEGQDCTLKKLEPNQHFTKPPPRYSEASLVKELEKDGIGRPSTYAPIISTIQHRGYVHKDGKYFEPTEIGTVVNDLLVEHFPDIVDPEFTANMEDDLDEIAAGDKEWVPVVRDFYEPFAEQVEQKDDELKKEDIAIEETDEICEECGEPMVIRLGRYGRFLACTGFPDCKNTRALEGNDEDKKRDDADYGTCPECGGTLKKRRGRYGPFLGCENFPDCKHTEQVEKDDNDNDNSKP